MLKPFCGKSISADVIRVNVAKGDDDDDDGVFIYCAVVADLHDEMILAENAISRLLQSKFEANHEFGDIQNNQADDNLCQNSDNFDCKSDSSVDSQNNSHLCNAVVMSDESDVAPSVECKQTQHSPSSDSDNTVDDGDCLLYTSDAADE